MVGAVLACATAATAAVSPNDCTGSTDSARIEAAIAAATGAEGSREVVIPARNARTGGDVWLIDRAILLPSNFTLTLSNAVVRLAPGVQDNIIRNAGTTNPEAPTGNEHITVRGLGSSTLSGGTGESHFTPAGDQSGWRTIGVLYYNVQHFTIENLTIQNMQCWSISVENGCSDGTIRNLHFENYNTIPNQDGVDVRKGCHDITIENLTGTTGDDGVAITGLLDAATPAETPAYTMQIGDRFWTGDNDIYNITIRNIYTTCSGGHGMVRLLNHDGVKLYNVTIENVIEPAGGVQSSRGVMIGDSNYSTVRKNQLGETYNVTVSNVQTYATTAVEIKGTLQDSSIVGVIPLSDATQPITVSSKMPTNNVAYVATPYTNTGTRTELEDAVLEIEVKPDGTCDKLVSTGDLLLAGTCTVELTLAAGNYVPAAADKYVVATWNGRCDGTFVLDAASAANWWIFKDEANSCFRLIPITINSGETKVIQSGTQTYSGVSDYAIGDTNIVEAVSFSGGQLQVRGKTKGSTTVTVFNGTTCTTYTVTVCDTYRAKVTLGVANDSTGQGTVLVTATPGASGTYNTTSTLTKTEPGTASAPFEFWAYAKPAAGYGFLGWSELQGALTYEGTNAQVVTVASSKASVPETKLFAHFGPTFTVTVATESSSKGSVVITNSTPAVSGLVVTNTSPLVAAVTAKATPVSASGYAFRRWKVVDDSGTTYVTLNPYAGNFSKTTTLTAEFSQVVAGPTIEMECDSTKTDSTRTYTGSESILVDEPDLLDAVIEGGKLKLTAKGWYGTDNLRTTHVKVDSGTVLVEYTISLSKPHHNHTWTVKVDEEKWCTDAGHEFPLDQEVYYTYAQKGIFDAYQKGDRVRVRGVNRGSTYVDIDAFYFSATYTVNVTKDYINRSITSSIGTMRLPIASGSTTAQVFTNITSVASADTGRVTARQVGDTVEITTLGEGDTLVTVDCHDVTWQYTVSVTLAKLSESYKIAIGETLDAAFTEITSITQADASKAYVAVARNGNTVSMTGLKAGSTSFAVVGKVAGTAGYVSKTMMVQVYDGSTGNIKYDDVQLNYDGVSTITAMPNGDLLMVFADPTKQGTFVIPEGYVAKARILAVGGGGAGGTQSKRGNGGGGGGAGGFTDQSDVVLRGGTYHVTVGAGGRRADVKTNPVAGNNGSNSVITNEIGYAYANALGGGGGAASLNGNTDGIYGGSGGGAAWYNGVVGAGGLGLNGQGMYGAVPTVLNNGGGGGGASADAEESTGGAGKTSDITGTSVVYARGGDGGLASATGPGADGEDGFGNGGAGGNGDFGGSGGDGVVIVRLTSAKQYTKIPLPTSGDGRFTDRFIFAEGQTFTAFNRAAFEAAWPGALAYVDGVITTNCWKETAANGSTVLHGVGYYSFVLYLNDGFAWDDGTTYGDTEGQLFHWRVVLSESDIDATVAVDKTVTWDSDTDATITITSHSTPEMNPNIPNILFLGGLCGSHSLTRDTVIATLNKVAEKGKVDYYLFPDHAAHPSSSYTQKDVVSTLQQGSTLSSAQLSEIKDFSTKTDLDADNHCVWSSFVTTITNVLKSSYATKYDYVIMEFDGNRLVHNLATTNKVHMGAATKAAEILKPLYAQGKVMWIVDSKNTYMKSNDPFINKYYTPSSWTEISGNTVKLADDKYALLLCLLDPKAILEVSDSRYNNKRSSTFSESNNVRKYAGITQFGYVEKDSASTYYRNDQNPLTTYYGNADQLMKDIESGIKVVAYNISGADTVKADVGLTVTGITVDIATETGCDDVRDVPESSFKEVLRWTPTGGAEITAAGQLLNITQNLIFDPETNQVEYNLTNLLVEAWTRLNIHVHDNGTFKSSVGAVQNPVTGKWEKNPNLGAAQVAFVDENGVETAVKGRADTIVPLSFQAYELSGEVVNGEIFMNGMTNNPAAFAAGYNPTISYRGEPGYALAELYVDGHRTAIDSTNEVYVLFRNLNANHHVKAVYVSVVGSISVAPTTHVYDRHVHTPVVTLGDDWLVSDPDENIRIEYAFSASAADSDWKTAEEWAAVANPTAAQKDVGAKTMYYRVRLKQPGWGEIGSEDNWVWKVVKSGSSTVTITHAALTIAAKGQSISAGAAVPQNGGVIVTGLVDSDTETSALTGTYKFTSSDYVPATSPAGMYHLMPGGKSANNYVITYVEGALAVGLSLIYVNGVLQASFLKPSATGVAPVEEVYDGTQYGLTVNVTQPTSGITTYWSADDAKTWSTTRPTYTDAGTYKVWYKVTDGDKSYITASNYQYVTISPRPITLTSASDTKMFDGKPLAKNLVTLTGGTLAGGESFTYECISRITEVDTQENEFKYTMSSGNGNYAVTKVLGVFTVTPAQINVNGVLQPNDPDPKQRLDQDHNGVSPVETVYDGTVTNLVIHVLKPETGAKVRYTTTPDDPSSLGRASALHERV